MIAPGPRLTIRKAQISRIRIHHLQGPEQALRRLMQSRHSAPIHLRQQALQGLALPLHHMNRPRLIPAFIDCENHAAIQKLLINVDRCRRQEQHHRAFHPVFLRHQLPRRIILARRGNRNLPLRLQQLQRIRRIAGPFFFRNRQYLMLEIGLAHVKQRLPRQGRVLHPLFFGHQTQNRLHQRRLARRR